MSLSGSVEDLPLLEILQVVSFCQKTGYLTVKAPEGEAGVVFDAGRVVSGFIWDVPPAPGGGSFPGREALVRRRIASVLERLVRLREGEFAFTLCDGVPTRLGGRDLAAETLPGGINPEELMLDLARRMDEDRRDTAAALEASFATPEVDDLVLQELPPEEETAPAPSAAATILLVDDEPEVRRVVGARLAAAGYEVREASGTDEAWREMGALDAARRPFRLVVDLGLPSSTGTTFRGGLDVVRQASGLALPPPVLLMAESLDEKIRGRARRLGVSLLAFKPGLSKLDSRQYQADLRAFGDKLARDVLPRLEARRAAPAPAATGASKPPPAPDEEARAAVLRSALEEMERSPDPDLVAFLLQRAARSFFPRVILFVVKDERLRGLSGFGPVDSADSLDLLARELTVELAEPSAFRDAVETGRSWCGPLPPDGPLRGLLDRIGPLGANVAAVLPVRAHREAVAVLYGDAPDGGTLPPIEPLVDFVERAGRALEETLLARRMAAAPA